MSCSPTNNVSYNHYQSAYVSYYMITVTKFTKITTQPEQQLQRNRKYDWHETRPAPE